MAPCWRGAFVLVLLLGLRVRVAMPRYVARIVTIEGNNTGSRYDTRVVGPTIDIALSNVRRLYGEYIDFSYEYMEAECSTAQIGSRAARAYHVTGVSVFIGPACAKSVEVLGYMAKEWNVPVMTPVGYKGVLKNKTLFPTVTRLSPYGQEQFALFSQQLLDLYGWRHLAIIYDDSEPDTMASLMGSTFVEFFMDTEYDWTDFPMGTEDLHEHGYQTVLKESSENARIFFLHASLEVVREMMLVAYRLGFTQGEYVFIVTVELEKRITSDVWQRGDGRDKEALEAFQSVLFMVIDKSIDSELQSFLGVVNRSVFDQHGLLIAAQKLHSITGYYDAFHIYAKVLNETLAEGGNPLDGREMSRRMWNRSYNGISSRIVINDEGGRDSKLGLLDFTRKGQTVVVGTYRSKDRVYEATAGRTIIWPNAAGPPLDVPLCGFRGYSCEYMVSDSRLVLGLSLGLSLLLVTALVLTGSFLWRRGRGGRADRWWWLVEEKELQMGATSGTVSVLSISSKLSQLTPRSDLLPDYRANLALYKGLPVHVRRLTMPSMIYDKELLYEFETIRSLFHPNLVRVLGACLKGDNKYILSEFCSKGSLQDMIGNSEITMDLELKFALCTDVIKGLCFLHESLLHHHGRLSSAVCLVDSRLRVKLSDYGPHSVFRRIIVNDQVQEFQQDCLWRAPEMLRGEGELGSREGDVYSLGLLLKEVFTGDAPYATETVTMGIDYVIEKIRSTDDTAFRPEFLVAEQLKPVRELAMRCWSQLPQHRPLIANVKRDISQIAMELDASGDLLDSLLRRMEQYANKLERLVDEKTVELREQKKRAEDLLDQILPRPVATQLKLGQRVQPDAFESVTVCFTDICGFTHLSSRSSPMQVVDLLNDIYSCFDNIIDNYDVYKVETIGDSYMVVSGLPVRNGDRHAPEITRMSLNLLYAINAVRIEHMEDERLKLRIGLHSGPVCAGVVGVKMPRYCLFGDTVNTASRMESHGEECRVHISGATKSLLDGHGRFRVEARGMLDIKGKGMMMTYWVLEELDPALDCEAT